MSVRYLILLAICIAICFVSLPRQSSTILSATHRELDIAIVGRGHLCLFAPETLERRYTRNGHLIIDPDGQLMAKVDGQQWLLDPPINIPSDWERITFLPEGRVQYLLADSWIDVGSIELVVFPASVDETSLLSANLYEEYGVPIPNAPGRGAGFIQQGWLEQSTSPISEVAIRISLVLVAALVLGRVTLNPVSEGRA